MATGTPSQADPPRRTWVLFALATLVALLVILVPALSASGGSDDDAPRAADADVVAAGAGPERSAVAALEPVPDSDAAEPGVSPLASRVTTLGSALYDPAEHPSLAPPVTVTVEGIGVVAAPVRDVGLLLNGEMEIPGADEVGWYRFGPIPGEAGSSVLAGHIAYDGRNGVFRYLADVEIGARVEVALGDGAVRSFEVVSVDTFDKQELPVELFRVDGEPALALITCGGEFQPSLRSYDSNVVAVAVPV